MGGTIWGRSHSSAKSSVEKFSMGGVDGGQRQCSADLSFGKVI